MIIREKQQKCHLYHQVKLINMNILQVKKYYLLIQEKALEKQSVKQVDALKPLDLSSQTDELKKIKGIFPKKPVERFDYLQIKKITHLQGIIKSNELDYISKRKKLVISVNIHYLLFFKKYIQEKLTLEVTDNEQSKLVNELNGVDQDV